MGQKISSSLSERFAAMSLFCACLIVFFHATPAPDKGSFNWWFFHIFGREGICCIAVPYFFACSGYFLAGHYGDEKWWLNEVVKRIKSLVVPFYIWMAVGILFGITVSYVKKRFLHVEVSDAFLSLPYWEKLVLYLGLHPFRDIGVLWYVRTLFLFVLVSPVIFFFLRWPLSTVCGLFGVHLATCYMFGFCDLDIYFLFDRFVSVRGGVYFFMGAVLRVCYSAEVLKLPFRTGVLCFSFGMMLLVAKNLLQLSSVGGGMVVEAISVPFLLVGIWGTFSIPRCLQVYSGCAFPIFLMHNIFLSWISIALMAVGLRDSMVLQIPIAMFRVGCAIVGAIGITFIIKRFLPRLGLILLGGRI